ncbi:tRNA:m(4)X modification enzyme TRM13 homolog [Limulus polyphemus]|uniref:tRNA:m(4)X modification enzyme TRM13 n=1 Tax=Limulus polyphemus TaxID=6850 RepID=A0ABM1TRK1_LIMPO|nr:tRNA:m(4)X modification enzyme TRM13 homolog [Limulus polyphemus]XP_022258507.1 tRNA:m(4)X modification enzyme TRM13 homolog [Limulus polyphemus]XP_022258508.1 tRNA:m(4)X modification enzyme TRM13 homolog [Limulus polyphemus]
MGLLESCGLVENNTCFVEFGAGRGQLSYWTVQAVPDESTCSFVSIDKGCQRHKFENRLKGENEPRIKRIRIDIQDLVLGKVPCVANHEGKIVGLSKHLCGAATDLSLRCLVENCCDQNNGNLKQCVEGLVLAPCCHHRCSWQSYVGQLFLKSHGFTPRDFQLMCGIASWATCGSTLQGKLIIYTELVISFL